jgi:hypothetical protein
VWVIITHLFNNQEDPLIYELQVRKSNGHNGTWGPLETVLGPTSDLGNAEGAIDGDDNITIIFRTYFGGYRLQAIRYAPGNGWSAAQEIYATADYFQATEIGADGHGNLAAVFDQEVAGMEAAWSIVYNSATGTWGTAQQVSSAGYRILMPTVLYSLESDTMYLVYLVKDGGPVGLYAHRFDTNTLTWGPPEFLPGSDIAGYQFAGPSTRLPGVVDTKGDVTVFWEKAYPGPYSPYASRNEAGVWKPAVRLLSLASKPADVENFSGASLSSANDVFGVATRFESGGTVFYASLYDIRRGLWETQNPYNPNLNFQTRSRVSFYRNRRAVATMLGVQNSLPQLTSIVYDGSAWLPELFDVPGVEDAFYQDMAADRGEALLVYEGEQGLLGSNYGIKASFLRAPQPGDFNNDCSVDLTDFVVFAECIDGPGEAPAPATPMTPYQCRMAFDFNSDGDVDLQDFAGIQNEFTGP